MIRHSLALALLMSSGVGQAQEPDRRVNFVVESMTVYDGGFSVGGDGRVIVFRDSSPFSDRCF